MAHLLFLLRMFSLPRLVRFYSGNATLHFTCLEEATIAECQNMKTFSEGIIDAPLLEGIKTSTEDTDLTSHHDLNTTIETLFHQQVRNSLSKFNSYLFISKYRIMLINQQHWLKNLHWNIFVIFNKYINFVVIF